MDIKRKIFYIFLTLHAVCWSLIQLMRNIISIDAMEAISWGELISFGTNKHPPLSGWLMAGFYDLFGKSDILVYILGQLCIIVGFIFVYKLAKFFMSEEKAFCASMILEFCFYYSYCVFIDCYNCNVVMFALWPMVAYYFYKAIREDKIRDWVLFGISSGLAFLGKYQIVFLFAGLFIYLIFANREIFKKKGVYLSVGVGTLVILPHVIWLFQNDFFSFAYMIERTDSVTHNMPAILVKLSHIVYPVKFIGDQILAVLACVGAYLLLAFQAKNISFKNEELNKKDALFLLSIGVIPILIHGFMGVVTGSRVPGIWGCIMVNSVGILLFSFFPINFKENSYKFFSSLCFAALTVGLIAVGIFGMLQTKYFIAFPHKKVMADFNQMWDIETNNSELKYVIGDMGYCFQFNIYNERHPEVILDTFGHKNPWANHEDILKSGVIVVGVDEQDVIDRTRNGVYLLPENYQITPKPYKMDICNKLGKCVKEEFYYAIIPPFQSKN